MKIYFPTFDRRVRGISVIFEMKMIDYWNLVKEIKSNPFQRRPIRKGDRTIQFLRSDIKLLCVMPPIVLSTTERFSKQHSNIIKKMLGKLKFTEKDKNNLELLATKAFDEREILILDGLQRTIAIDDVLNELSGKLKRDIEKHSIRIELYLGLNTAGILYRMLTLNTGQTRMSTRHQLEIVYRDYYEGLEFPEDIKIVREVDRKRASQINIYNFSNVIELYIACLYKNPAPLGKETVFDRIASMDFLEKYGLDIDSVMMRLLELYHKLSVKIDENSKNWKLPKKDLFLRTFGKDVPMIFGKSQPMTGFGSACRHIVPDGNSLTAIEKSIDAFDPVSESLRVGLYRLLEVLNDITERGYRTKIGPLQRQYFELFFRSLLDEDSESYLDFKKSVDRAFEKFLVIN